MSEKLNVKRMMRQIVDFMWKKHIRGGITPQMLLRITDVIDMPTPREWRA